MGERGFVQLAPRLDQSSGDILTGSRTFTAEAIINIRPTETSFGSGVNTCQSGSEPRHHPLTQQLQLLRPRAAPPGDTLTKVQI